MVTDHDVNCNFKCVDCEKLRFLETFIAFFQMNLAVGFVVNVKPHDAS